MSKKGKRKKKKNPTRWQKMGETRLLPRGIHLQKVLPRKMTDLSIDTLPITPQNLLTITELSLPLAKRPQKKSKGKKKKWRTAKMERPSQDTVTTGPS